jgi:xanthine dehydrogenase accessory factor
MVSRLGAREAARKVRTAEEEGRGVVVLLVLQPGADEGARRVVTCAGGEGAIEDPALAATLDDLGQAILAGREAPGPKGREAGSRTLNLAGREVRVYVERYLPAPELVVVGAGHIARPVTAVAALLGFRVTVLDDRPDFARAERFPQAERVLRVDFTDPFREVPVGPVTHVLLVTRGHRYDYECLRRLLAGDPVPPYIGMIGSRRRVRGTFHQLREEGFGAEAMARVRAPVGLDVGAQTPEEIAVAVLAELVLLRRGGTGAPLTEVEEVARRFFKEEERIG